MSKKKQKEKKTEKFYTISDTKIEEIRKNAEKEALIKAFIMMMGFSVITLSDHFEDLKVEVVDGKRREMRFTDYVFGLWEQFNKGEIEMKDCIDVLRDECDMDILMEKNHYFL